MKREDLKEILERHQKWLKDEVEGKRANLSGADLSETDLFGANLIGANLIGANLSVAYLRKVNLSSANLSRANLIGADLSSADLSGANLSGADLSRANLSGADLSRANLIGADLSSADLSGADLSRANLSRAKITNVIYACSTSFFSLQCPEKGSFIGYKKCANNLIVELEILSDSKRSSATSRKCRCEKAKVLAIYNVDKTPSEKNIACSLRDDTFYYEINQIVIVNNFDENRWNECSTGIHFFLTFDEAKTY